MDRGGRCLRITRGAGACDGSFAKANIDRATALSLLLPVNGSDVVCFILVLFQSLILLLSPNFVNPGHFVNEFHLYVLVMCVYVCVCVFPWRLHLEFFGGKQRHG